MNNGKSSNNIYFWRSQAKRGVKYHEAYGNIPALGLGKLVCMRQVAVVWGTHGDMRVIHGIGYQKTCLWTKIVARASKMEPEGDKRDKGTKGKHKGSQMEPKGCHKGLKRQPNGAKRMPKGAQSEPNGIQRPPKGSQRAIKMHPRIDLRTRSRKGSQNGRTILYFLVPFWSNFLSKIDEQIDAKIDAEQVLKLGEKTMRKLIGVSILFENCFHEKT